MPLLDLQDTLTLFLYFLWAILTDISSVSGQERWSPEAVSRSESTKLPLDELESENTWSLALLGLPAAVSLSGSADPLVGLEEELGDFHCGGPELVLVSGVGLGIWSLRHVELCSLLTLTSEEVMQVLLMWEWLVESLGVWSHSPFGGMVTPAKGCPNKGVPSEVMLSMEKTDKGDIIDGGDGPGNWQAARLSLGAGSRTWMQWRHHHPGEQPWMLPPLHSGGAPPWKCTRATT